jgi:Uma2 family endonuclease
MGATLKVPGQTVTMFDISWRTYTSLLEDYAGYGGVRINYDRGTLEIRCPGAGQEYVNRCMEGVAAAIVEEWDGDITKFGSTTFKREDLERGFEPDSCFYISAAAEMRTRTEIDLRSDPAPDLVIEIDDTSSSLDKLALYAAIGVREVWRYRNGTITMYALDGDAYAERAESLAFPALTPALLAGFVAESRTLRRPEWMRRVREWARNNPG